MPLKLLLAISWYGNYSNENLSYYCTKITTPVEGSVLVQDQNQIFTVHIQYSTVRTYSISDLLHCTQCKYSTVVVYYSISTVQYSTVQCTVHTYVYYILSILRTVQYYSAVFCTKLKNLSTESVLNCGTHAESQGAIYKKLVKPSSKNCFKLWDMVLVHLYCTWLYSIL